MDSATLRILVTVLAFVVPLWGFIFVWARSWFKFIKLASKIPGPSLWYTLRNMSRFVHETVPFLYELTKSYNFKPFRVPVMGNMLVLITEPEDIVVFTKHKDLRDKPNYFYGEIASYLDQSILTLNGSTWKHHRQTFNPGFHKQVLGGYIPLFNSQAQEFATSVRQFCTGDGETVDISGLIAENLLLTTLKVGVSKEWYSKPVAVGFAQQLAKTVRLSGIDFVDLMRGVSRNIEEVVNVIHVTSMDPGKRYVSSQFRNDVQRISKDCRAWKDFFQKIISLRREEVENMLKDDTDFSPSSSLDHAMVNNVNKDKLNLSDKELADDVVLFLIAGAETTTLTINVVLALLALHPVDQAKVSEELFSIFEGSDREVTMDDLRKMEYLECVIKEGLRLFPAVPTTVREAKKDVNMNGTIVPEGSYVGLFIWGLHRNPKYFENPNEFHPERFRPGNEKKLPQYGFIPFSVGPRICIGSRYAMIQMKTFLSTFLRRYQVRPGEGLSAVEDIKVAIRFVMRLTSQVPLRLYPRSWAERSD